MSRLEEAIDGHTVADLWPGAAVLAFMDARIEDSPARLTVQCLVDHGAAELCTGRVALWWEEFEDTQILWPATGCSNGHDLMEVENAYTYHVDRISLGKPDSDPVADFEQAVTLQALKAGISASVLRTILERAHNGVA